MGLPNKSDLINMNSMHTTHLIKKSFRLAGHATSVALEPVFWDVLITIAKNKGLSLTQLVFEVDATMPPNLASALRVHVVRHLRKSG